MSEPNMPCVLTLCVRLRFSRKGFNFAMSSYFTMPRDIADSTISPATGAAATLP